MEKRELVYMLLVDLFVYFACATILSFCSSSWYHGLAAAFDCGIPWTLRLTIFQITHMSSQMQCALDVSVIPEN